MYECLFVSNCNYQAFPTQYREANMWVKILTIIGLCVIIAMKILFAWWMENVQRDTDSKFVTVNDFTIYVQGLDKSQND